MSQETLPPIPLVRPELDGNSWNYLRECLESGWVSSAGPFVGRFEQAVAAYLDVPFAVATMNGTASLHLALLVAGVQPEDEVILSPLIFVACANAVRHAGARPVFIDVDPDYGQLDPERVIGFLEKECRRTAQGLFNLKSGRRVSALLMTHAFGHPSPVSRLLEIARRFELKVIEDAAESLGARYRGELTGRFGDVSCLSFNGNKLVTAGGGGMLVTREPGWAQRARHLSTHAKADPDEYWHDEVGFNYRLSNLHAALGCAQLERLPSFLERKRRMAEEYQRLLSSVSGFRVLTPAPWAVSNHWMLVGRIEATSPLTTQQLRQQLSARGIGSAPLWVPLDRLPAHQSPTHPLCPVAWEWYRRGISLPASVGITAEEMRRVGDALQNLLPAQTG